jgi:hypothetical protein
VLFALLLRIYRDTRQETVAIEAGSVEELEARLALADEAS